MKTYTFTPKQFKEYSKLIVEVYSYDDTNESHPLYEEFLEKTFGDDWFDYHEGMYEYEWNPEFYYGLITGVFNKEIQDWIETEKKDIAEFREDELANEDCL